MAVGNAITQHDKTFICILEVANCNARVAYFVVSLENSHFASISLLGCKAFSKNALC